MSAGSRPTRIGDQLRVELSDLIARQVQDPGIGFLTITHVKVSADLQVARVYYTTLGDEKARRESGRALGRATPFLRRQIGARLRLKRVPSIEFVFDESVERGDRIEQILRDLDSDRSEAAGAAGGAAGEAAGEADEAAGEAAGEDRPTPDEREHDD
jgi:ribosome-binding factor A